MVDSPTDRVIALRAQGLSNNQIVQQLQQQGLSAHAVFEALNMADMKQSFGQPMPPPNMPPPSNPMGMAPQSMLQPPSSGPQSNQEVEELIEAVIEEKWKELKRSVDKVVVWKDRTDEKLARLEQQVEDIRKEFDKLHQAVVGKIGDYDKNILEVGTQLQAMEKVFSKVLPAFTENVQELTRITEKMKGN